MKTRVIAVLVVREGGDHLARTLEGIRRQTRKPDVLLVVDNSAKEAARAQLNAFGASLVIPGSPKFSFGESLEVASRSFPAVESGDDYLWFLAQDSAPTSSALAELLAALEVAPSVAIAGPKQMNWEDPDYIHEFGLTLSQGGRTISLVHDELDQGQHDQMSDVLAVGGNGMLLRQQLWVELGGFDPHLRVVDDALDFCVRARLAGHRVSVVPAAKVLTAGDGVIGARGDNTGRARKKRERQYRSAELYRRLVYATGFALFWHWLGLLPSAVVRSLGQLLAKRPGAVSGEYRAALSAAFSGGAVGHARRRLRATKNSPWAALAALKISRADVRRRNALAQEAARIRQHGERRPLRFFTGGGAWVTLGLFVVSLIALSPLVGANAISGGALLPLGNDLGELWSQVGFGLRAGAFQLTGPGDAFAVIAALLGSLTWWQPSLSLVLLWFAAIPLAGLGAWFLAARLTERAGIRGFIAVAYALAPTLLSALNEGRPTAVLAHLILPWVFFTGIRAARSWSASATTALLFAAVVACAPSLTPALLIVWLGSLLLTGRSIAHYLAIPLPAVALAAPLVVMQVFNLNLFGLAADPGPAVDAAIAPNWQIALGFPVEGLGGWLQSVSILPWALPAASVVVLIFVSVLLALAFVGLFSQYPIRAQLSLLVALLGLATAVLASGLSVSYAGSVAVPIWPGNGLSLAWLGLAVAAGTGASILRQFSFYPVTVGLAAVVLLAIPALAAAPLSNTLVRASNGNTLPAYVVAQSAITPNVGTLVLTPQPRGGLGYTLVRGTGLTLASTSTYVTTGSGVGLQERRLAELVTNVVSVSDSDIASELKTLGVGFVLLTPAETYAGSPVTAAAQAMTSRVRAALDSNSTFGIVGITDAGLLWRYPGFSSTAINLPQPSIPVEPWRTIILAVQALIILLTLLLAIPTGNVRTDIEPRRKLPGLIEGDEIFDSVDPLAGELDVEEN